MSDRKVLFLDIETAPLLAHIWHPRQEFTGREMLIESESFLLTWAARFRGQKKIRSMRLTKEEALEQDDSRVVAGLADLVRQADVVVAHNGDRFDIRHLNARLLLNDLEPLGPVESIDTLKWSQRTFKLSFHRLDYLGEVLGVGRKVKHPGFSMWRRAYQGDVESLKTMERYNRGDIELLEAVFEKLLPYAKGAPRLHLADGFACSYCGSENIQRRGYHTTAVHTYARYRCHECQRYSRARLAAAGGRRPELAPIRG